MQKVVYSISKVNKDEKLKGVGYLVDGNLLIPATSSKGNPYIRVFEDVSEKCKPVLNEKDEFKGYISIAYENIQVFNKEKNHYDTLDYIETTYFIWYKYIVWESKFKCTNLNDYKEKLKMKLTLKNVKEEKRKSDNLLTKYVCNYVINQWHDYEDKTNIFTKTYKRTFQKWPWEVLFIS